MKNFRKLNLNEIRNVMSKSEMKKILAGSGSGSSETKCNCNTKDDCSNSQLCYNCGSNGSDGQKWGYCAA